MRGKPLILKKLDNGCIVPTSHKLNADGYFRYHPTRKDKAKEYWMENHCTGIALSKLFDVSFSTTCRWIREWKA